VRNNIPLFVSPSDSTLRARRASPAEHSKPYDPVRLCVCVCLCLCLWEYVWVRGCSVLVLYTIVTITVFGNFLRDQTRRPCLRCLITTVLTSPNNVAYSSRPSLPIIRTYILLYVYYYPARLLCAHDDTVERYDYYYFFFHFSFFVNIAAYICLISWGYSRYF